MEDTINKPEITLEDLAIMVKIGFDALDKKFEEMDTKMDSKLNKLKTQLVTKDYLDEKIADLRGDLVLIIRGEDKKIMKLVEILSRKNILNETEQHELITMKPFPQVI